ncbi:MAG: undecaprenyl diphosphate synthase family protein [Acidimicrobiales bacterium]
MDLTGIDPKRIPRHVAAVMDGNGRWATQRGLKRTEGHGGEQALFDTLDGAIELGLDWFTVSRSAPRTGSARPTRSAT